MVDFHELCHRVCGQYNDICDTLAQASYSLRSVVPHVFPSKALMLPDWKCHFSSFQKTLFLCFLLCGLPAADSDMI